MKKRKSLKWKMISIMLLYWVLPFLVIIGTIGMYLFTSQVNGQMERLASRAELNTKTCVERLEGVVANSRQATYDGTLFEKYREYKRGRLNERAFSNSAQLYLDGQYAHKENNSVAALMLLEDPKNKKYASCNFSTGGSYAMIQTVFNEDREAILTCAENLDTAVGFLRCEGRYYVVRNLVDKSFHPWGVLVNRVNVKYCFETIIDFEEELLVELRLNGEDVIRTGTEKDWAGQPEIDYGNQGEYLLHKDRAYVFCGMEGKDFELKLLLNAKKRTVFSPLYGYIYVVLMMVLMLIPLLIMFFHLSRKYLSNPVETMMACAGEIEKGNLGYQMEGDTGSMEFEYLRESFNSMSTRLKYQFDHIYEEELALRDAKIMALQSHINPHFMNNTLEIINWEARLSGNEKVSKMIGALSTLMDAAIDRRRLPEVKLSEEMVYVNAYLYITQERLGKRLVIRQELPQEIMNLKVPRLIMQPIIENAIEHGIVPSGSGCVCIRGRREKEYLYLEVINDGDFDKEDEARVARLLAPDYDTSKESSGNMGIANVNQRLRILYGESCGLTVKKYRPGQTISVLTILVGN